MSQNEIGSLDEIRRDIEAQTNGMPHPYDNIPAQAPQAPVPQEPVVYQNQESNVAPAIATETETVLKANENMDNEKREQLDQAVDIDAIEKENEVLESSLEGEILIGNDDEDDAEEAGFVEKINILNKPTVVKETSPGANHIRERIKTASASTDLANAKVTKSASALTLSENLSFLQKINPVHTYPIVAMKSGYRAFLRPLSNNDKLVVRGLWTSPISSIDRFLKLVRLIYSQIESNSYRSVLSFTDFMRDTAEDDLATLMFGVYAGTFPNATEYALQCPHCGEQLKVKVTPNQLLEVVHMKESGRYVQELIQNIDKGEEFVKRSLVKVTHPVTAPETGIIFNLRNPSIQDAVNSMKLTERLKNSSYSDALLANVRFVDSILVPDYGSLQAGGELTYFEVTDVNEFLTIFDKYLTDTDANFILESIVKYSEEYSVNYRIGQITCPNSKCGKVIKKVNVDIANLLFLGSAGGKIQG